MTAKNILSNIIVFAAGAIVGSAVTYKVVESKCRQEAQDEIESVRAHYRKDEVKTEEAPDSDDEEECPGDAPEEYYEKTSERERYNSIIKGAGYSEEEEEDMDRPYVITPEEYAEGEYPNISLTYYADGVVTNDRGKIIRNVDELIGEESLNHFGEYEEDTVYVRNDKHRVDYEICKDYREFSEIS